MCPLGRDDQRSGRPALHAHGFFYFDVNHHYDWLSNARFYVPDLSFMLDNKALFFFEIDLAAAAP